MGAAWANGLSAAAAKASTQTLLRYSSMMDEAVDALVEALSIPAIDVSAPSGTLQEFRRLVGSEGADV